MRSVGVVGVKMAGGGGAPRIGSGKTRWEGEKRTWQGDVDALPAIVIWAAGWRWNPLYAQSQAQPGHVPGGYRKYYGGT